MVDFFCSFGIYNLISLLLLFTYASLQSVDCRKRNAVRRTQNIIIGPNILELTIVINYDRWLHGKQHQQQHVLYI